MFCVSKRAAFSPLFLFALFVAGCAADGSGSRPTASAPRHNLSGYSAAFKQGYADACASPRRRSEARFKSETDYQMGWNDGNFLCSRTKN